MDDLQTHPESGHLVGIQQAPPTPNHGSGATPEEAANKIRGKFRPESTPPELQHQSRFLTAVAAQLGVEPTGANLIGISRALEEEGVEFPDLEYPKMLYSRNLPDPKHNLESHIDLRNDHVAVVVNNQDQADELGTGWIDDPTKLPDRKEGDTRFNFDYKAPTIEGARTAEPGDHIRPHFTPSGAGPGTAQLGDPDIASGAFHKAEEIDIAGGTSVSSGGSERVSSDPVKVVVQGQPETRAGMDNLEHRTGEPTAPVRPGEWDPERREVRNRDGSVDETRTNEERLRRQVGEPWAKDAAEKRDDPTR